MPIDSSAPESRRLTFSLTCKVVNMPQTVIAFDLFGTILSTDSTGQRLEEIYGKDDARRIATEARRLQLEYTWRCNSMGRAKEQFLDHEADMFEALTNPLIS